MNGPRGQEDFAGLFLAHAVSAYCASLQTGPSLPPPLHFCEQQSPSAKQGAPVGKQVGQDDSPSQPTS